MQYLRILPLRKQIKVNFNDLGTIELSNLFPYKLLDELRVKIWKHIQGSYQQKDRLINGLVFTYGYKPEEMEHLIDIISSYEYRL